MNILIVEDDKPIRELLKEYLCNEREGRDCDSAETISGAIAAISKKRYDLIVLDLLLDSEISVPIIEYARRLWKDNPPTICIISAMVGAEQIAKDNKIDCFLPKPFDLDIIDELIDKNKLH